MTVSWRVGAILNESVADTLRFAAWYLEAGADGLTLLFDNPDDPAIDLLSGDPRISCIRCTPDFWTGLGVAPDTRFPKRQNIALSDLYRHTREDWLVNVDADEFLYLKSGRIADLLSAQTPQTDYLRVETAEVIATGNRPGRSVFRLPMERDAALRVYGDSAGLFGPRRKGLVGHPQGKSAIRTGLPGVVLRQHWPQRSGGGADLRETLIGRAEGAHLLHFIGLDYDAWHRKLDWRTGSRGFTVPLTERIRAAIQSPDAERELRLLHQDLHMAESDRLDRLRAEGARLDLTLDRDALARRVFGTRFPAE